MRRLMMRLNLLLLVFAIVFGCGYAHGAESAADMIKKLDYNQSPDSVIYDVQMVIHQANRVDIKTMRMYGEGQSKAFTLFLSPPRDKDTAMLRLDDSLWTYLPSAEKTMKISGHMLRQSLMGSDFSYSDITERVKLLELYDPAIVGTDRLNGESVTILELRAKEADANYFIRKIWMDQNRYTALKQEMYAKSGKLLKVMTTEGIQKIGDRYFATKLRMEDKLKKSTYTELIFTNIRLDEKIPASTFTLQNLEKRQ